MKGSRRVRAILGVRFEVKATMNVPFFLFKICIVLPGTLECLLLLPVGTGKWPVSLYQPTHGHTHTHTHTDVLTLACTHTHSRVHSCTHTPHKPHTERVGYTHVSSPCTLRFHCCDLVDLSVFSRHVTPRLCPTGKTLPVSVCFISCGPGRAAYFTAPQTVRPAPAHTL